MTDVKHQYSEISEYQYEITATYERTSYTTVVSEKKGTFIIILRHIYNMEAKSSSEMGAFFLPAVCQLRSQ